MKTKNSLLLAAVIACLFALGSCKKNDNPNAYNMDKDTSYAIGMYLASQWQIPDVYYDYQSLIEGFQAYNEMRATRFDMNTALDKINAAFEEWAARQGYSMPESGDMEDGLEEGILFLAENSMRPGVITTASGLQYEIITEGQGEKPAVTDIVRVNYEGTFINGNVFDSSYARGEPVEFPLDGVIPGWTEGVQLMNEGSIYRFFIPSDLAYGPYGAGSSIPPNSTLIFQVELISIIR